MIPWVNTRVVDASPGSDPISKAQDIDFNPTVGAQSGEGQPDKRGNALSPASDGADNPIPLGKLPALLSKSSLS
jgi:hypothetical protein